MAIGVGIGNYLRENMKRPDCAGRRPVSKRNLIVQFVGRFLDLCAVSISPTEPRSEREGPVESRKVDFGEKPRR
jgi:hypothetical protein